MIRTFVATLFLAALMLTAAAGQGNKEKDATAKETGSQVSKEKSTGKTTSTEKQKLAPGGKPGATPLPRPTPPAGSGGKDGGGMKDKGGMKPGDKGNGDAGNAQLGADVMILNVMKNDAAAKPNPNGAGRLVPVKVEWKVKLSPGAKLMELEAMLKTTNTDNSMTTVNKMLSLTANSDTIMLPMPEGVFAKEFVLKINSKCATGTGRTVASSQTKTGMFPVATKQ